MECVVTRLDTNAPSNLLTRWDVSSIPANGIFLTKNKKNKIKMPNGWRTINSLVHKIRLHGRRGKGKAESFSRQKSRHAPQKEGGLKILCDLPPVWPRLVRPTNLMSRMDGKKTHTHSLRPRKFVSLPWRVRKTRYWIGARRQQQKFGVPV